MSFGGLTGSADYAPLIDDTKPIVILWKREQYQTVTDPAKLQAYGLSEKIPEQMLGKVAAYLCISGANEYESVGHVTSMILYVCEDHEDVYVLKDPERCVFVVPMEE